MLNFSNLKAGDKIHYEPLNENMYVLDVWQNEEGIWNAFIYWEYPENYIIINEFDEDYYEEHR